MSEENKPGAEEGNKPEEATQGISEENSKIEEAQAAAEENGKAEENKSATEKESQSRGADLAVEETSKGEEAGKLGAAASSGDEPGKAAAVDPEREAKLKAAAEARAARAAAKAKAEAEAAEAANAEPEPPKEPSPRQGDLELCVRLITEALGAETIEEATLNELNGDMPTIVIAKEKWLEAGGLLRDHEELKFNYLRNVSGVDYESHLEVVYFLLSLDSKRDVAIKVRAERDNPSIPSATPLWSTANWNEREIFDLLGIEFQGHPDPRRIMMPDDWAGHPLRKDYEPLDSEV